jgi:hypothetical protein
MGITDVKAFGTDGSESTAVGFEFKAKLSHACSRIKSDLVVMCPIL